MYTIEEEKVWLKAKAAMEQGNLIVCSKEEYALIRSALQTQAGRWLDQEQLSYAYIALQEIKRLDILWAFSSTG